MPILEVSYQQLLDGVQHLSGSDLEKFVKDVMTIKARRKTDNLPKDEAELLEKINQGLPLKLRLRYKDLMDKKEGELLTEEEYQELLDITKQKEQLNNQRISHLITLAEIRKTTLRELMNDLKILNHG